MLINCSDLRSNEALYIRGTHMPYKTLDAEGTTPLNKECTILMLLYFYFIEVCLVQSWQTVFTATGYIHNLQHDIKQN